MESLTSSLEALSPTSSRRLATPTKRLMVWLVSFCGLLHLLRSLHSEAAAPVAFPGRKVAPIRNGPTRGVPSVIKAGRERGKRLAYYSVFCGTDGNEAAVVSVAPSKVFDCYFVTDNDKALQESKIRGWISLRMPGEPSDDSIGANMKCKDLRTRPHRYRFLSSYDYLVFIDSKIVTDVHDSRTLTVIEGMPPTAALVHRRHNLLTKPPFSVWQEFELAMNQPRYKLQESHMTHCVNKKLQEGFSELKSTHLLGGYIVRNMRHPRVREIGEYWYQNILECGIEDQISLFFVHQRFHELYHVIDSFPI